MKKALIFALSLMMLVVFAVGCSSKDDAKDTATEAPTVEATTEATEEPAADDTAATEEATDDTAATDEPAETESTEGSSSGISQQAAATVKTAAAVFLLEKTSRNSPAFPSGEGAARRRRMRSFLVGSRFTVLPVPGRAALPFD